MDRCMDPTAIDDRRFERMMADATTLLTYQSVLVCIGSKFDAGRMPILWQTVRALTGLTCRQLDIVLVSDILAPAQENMLRRLFEPLIDVEIRQFRPADPTLLLWEHKPIIAERFLAPGSDYDLFIFIEDDLILSPVNAAYFLGARPLLAGAGFLPSFVRIEYNHAQQRLYAADQVGMQPRDTYFDIEASGLLFQHMQMNFCAMYMLDRDLAERHVRSPMFREDSSRSLERMDPLVRASIGPAFEDIPPGYAHRAVVPVRRGSHRLRRQCLVHHHGDKGTNNPDIPHGKLPLINVFA